MTGAEVGLADRRETAFAADDLDAPGAAKWWQTLRTIVVSAAEIALKVLPILLEVLEQQAKGEAPGDDQVVLTTGPLQWQVSPRALSVSVTNGDQLQRAVTVTMSPDAETGEAAISFVVPPGATQPVEQAVWARIARGQDGSLVSISVPGAGSVADPQGKEWILLFRAAFNALTVGQALRYVIPGERNGSIQLTYQGQPSYGFAWQDNNRRDAQIDVRVKTAVAEIEVSSKRKPPSPDDAPDGAPAEVLVPFPPGFVSPGDDTIVSGSIEVFGPPPE